MAESLQDLGLDARYDGYGRVAAYLYSGTDVAEAVSLLPWEYDYEIGSLHGRGVLTAGPRPTACAGLELCA